jgi:hypothetical protein
MSGQLETLRVSGTAPNFECIPMFSCTIMSPIPFPSQCNCAPGYPCQVRPLAVVYAAVIWLNFSSAQNWRHRVLEGRFTINLTRMVYRYVFDNGAGREGALNDFPRFAWEVWQANPWTEDAGYAGNTVSSAIPPVVHAPVLQDQAGHEYFDVQIESLLDGMDQ